MVRQFHTCFFQCFENELAPKHSHLFVVQLFGLETLQKNFKGLASYCKAETTFTFHFSILTLSSAFLSINNTEMKSESGFSLAMAIQPFCLILISR